MPDLPELATGWLRQSNNKETVVVFVHGIISGGVACWKANNDAYWPALLAQEESLQSLGIYIFSYDTGIFSRDYSMSHIVASLREHLKVEKIREFKRVIFVCHSMGGIIVRRYLVAEKVDLARRASAIGLFLVASPSLGSRQATTWGPLIAVLGNVQANNLKFSEKNEWLNMLDSDFMKLKAEGLLTIHGKELLETKGLKIPICRWFAPRLLRKTVESFSAGRYFGDPYPVERTDHSTIAKPTSSKAIQHRVLVDFINEVIALGGSKYAINIVPGFTLESVAKVIVETNTQGYFLELTLLSAAERNTGIFPREFKFDSLVEGFELLQHIAATPVRSYRVEQVDRVYRFIPSQEK